MKRPAKKKTTVKKAAKKPAAKRASAKKPAAAKSTRRASSPSSPRVEAYMPKPIEGVGWPAFRYPLS